MSDETWKCVTLQRLCASVLFRGTQNIVAGGSDIYKAYRIPLENEHSRFQRKIKEGEIYNFPTL